MTTTRQTLLHLLPYARIAPRLVVATTFIGLCSSLAESIGLSLFIPLLQGLGETPSAATSQRFVALLSAAFSTIPQPHRVSAIALCILGAIFLRSALAYATQLLYAALDARVGRQLRSSVLKQLLAVGFRYWERRASDRLFTMLAEDTWRVTNAVRTWVFAMVTTCALLAYLSVLLLIDWKLTFLVSIALLTFHALTRLLTRRAVSLGRLFTRTNSVLTKRMIETFQGMQVIRAFGREAYELERFDRASEKVSNALFRTARTQAISGPLLELLAASTVVGLLVTVSSRAQDLPALLVFLLILYRLQPTVRDLTNALVSLATLRSSVEQISSLLSREGKPYSSGGSIPFDELRFGICFDGVSFSYVSGERPALEAASVFIPAGKTTALVGPSGSGKSTFVKLLQGLYDPDQGQILFDDRPLSALELSGLRRQIAAVSQEVYLFDASIRSNIAYGRPEASLEEVIEAAKQADAHDFISASPAGYETRVGERGAALSGGQAQRIALARAIVSKPQVLILDEATNALDAMSENVVHAALNALQGRCTVVIVAHRFSTIERAEKIIVMEQGRILEQGSFNALLRKGSLFAKLRDLQFGQRVQLGSSQ